MKPYVEPKMRRKMGMMDSPPAAAAPSPMDEGGMDEPSNESAPTAFLPKEMGGGKQWKPGDEIVLKVDAVDPETGEMQVSYASEEPGKDDAEPADTMSAMDKAMPPDDGNGGGY